MNFNRKVKGHAKAHTTKKIQHLKLILKNSSEEKSIENILNIVVLG